MLNSFLRQEVVDSGVFKMKKADLGAEKTLPTIFTLMFPAMASQLVNVLYNIVDRIYVGNLPQNGEISLVGVGVCSPITTFITSFAYLVGLGASPLFSMSLGQHRDEDAKKIMSNSILMLVVLSVLITIIFYACLTPMLYAFGASEASFPYARDYMIYYLMGAFFAIMAAGLTQFLSAQGESLWAMIATFSSAILNIILDPVFMYAAKMGVKGAAVATTISWGVWFIIVVIVLAMKTRIRLSFGNYSLKIMWKIVKLGFSPFIILSTDSLIIILLNAELQNYGGAQGDFYIEASTIVQAFFTLITGPLLGISSGTQPILAYQFGAKRIDLLKKSEKQITLCGLVFTTACFILSFFLAEPFADLFVKFSNGNSSSAQEVVKEASKVIHWYCYGLIPLTFQYVQVDGLTGFGQAKYSVWLSLNRKVVLLMTLILVLPAVTGKAETAFYAEPIADTVSGFVSLTVYLIVTPHIFRKQMESKGSALDNA